MTVRTMRGTLLDMASWKFMISQAELGRLCDIPCQTISFWTKRGELPIDRSNGQLVLEAEDLILLALVGYLRRHGSLMVGDLLGVYRRLRDRENDDGALCWVYDCERKRAKWWISGPGERPAGPLWEGSILRAVDLKSYLKHARVALRGGRGPRLLFAQGIEVHEYDRPRQRQEETGAQA